MAHLLKFQTTATQICRFLRESLTPKVVQVVLKIAHLAISMEPLGPQACGLLTRLYWRKILGTRLACTWGYKFCISAFLLLYKRYFLTFYLFWAFVFMSICLGLRCEKTSLYEQHPTFFHTITIFGCWPQHLSINK